MRMTMIGSGYVGWVSGACLADLGHDGTCVDKGEALVSEWDAFRAPDLRLHPRDAVEAAGFACSAVGC